MNGLEIIPMQRSKSDVRRFLKMPYLIYDHDPNWVAPLLSDLEKVFTDANPLFSHAEMQMWVARKNGRDVGRIAGVIDHHYNKGNEQPVGFYGFYECVDDSEVSRELFKAVHTWIRAKGLNKVLGPMNPTTNDECGLLVEGFDSPPVFMMTYNPQYYMRLMDEAGYSKAKDLLAYYMDLAKIPMDRLKRISQKVKDRNPNLTFRPLLKKTLTADLGKVKDVYNAAWQDNWGFVPMTDEEIDFMAARLKPLLTEGLIWIVESKEEAVGFLLAMPDFNMALKPLKGKLLTPKLLGALPQLMGWKWPNRTRVLTLGVKEKYRSKGLESAMLIEGLRVGIEHGVTESEASWILEDNVMMCRMLDTIGGRVYKRYRIYQKDLP